MCRITGMTLVQSIITTHDDIVADISDFFVVRLSWLDVELVESDIPTWFRL